MKILINKTPRNVELGLRIMDVDREGFRSFTPPFFEFRVSQESHPTPAWRWATSSAKNCARKTRTEWAIAEKDKPTRQSQGMDRVWAVWPELGPTLHTDRRLSICCMRKLRYAVRDCTQQGWPSREWQWWCSALTLTIAKRLCAERTSLMGQCMFVCVRRQANHASIECLGPTLPKARLPVICAMKTCSPASFSLCRIQYALNPL